MTIRAVRHYHQRGLLEEPPRDSSGYRRYALQDLAFQAIYLDYDAAYDWSPDDPRLPELADRAHRWLVDRQGDGREGAVPDPAAVELAATSTGAMSPAWICLAELARKRGTMPAKRP